MTKVVSSISAMFLMALCNVFAQAPKPATTQPAYRCMSGIPMWRDLGPSSDRKAEDAAYADCKALIGKERAEDDKSFGAGEDAMQKMDALHAQSRKLVQDATEKLCQQRTIYRDDGTDIEWCASVPPRLDVLIEAREMCNESPGLKMCKHLIPLSAGKAYNIIKVSYQRGLFPNYSSAILTLQGQDGIWEDKFLGEEKQFSELVGFNADKAHILTVVPKDVGDQTFKYTIPAGSNYSFTLGRTYCNTIPSGYSLYFPDNSRPPIRPEGWNFRNCEN